MYHASGHTDDCDATRTDGVCFEKINLGTLAITTIDVNGTDLTDEETQALTYWDDQGVFLWKQDHGTGPLFRVTAAGVPTLIGDLDHQAKGLAFVNTPTTVPEPATLALLGIAFAGIRLARRRKLN